MLFDSIKSLFDRPARGNRRRANRKALLQVEQLEDRLTPSVDVLTYHNDLARDGQNLNETSLTTSNVNSSDFGLQFNTSLSGAMRNQPLLMTGLNVGGSPHDVIFAATMNSELYALDAHSGQILWQDDVLPAHFGGSVTPYSGDAGFSSGFSSTPVIDPNTGTLYGVTELTETVGSTKYTTWWTVAVNISTGVYVDGGPHMFASDIYNNSAGGTYVSGPTVNGTGYTPSNSPAGTVAFDSTDAAQRPALTLNQGSVYVAFSSATDAGDSHGWVLRFSETNLQLTGVLCTTPNNGTGLPNPLTSDVGQGGIWQGGGGGAVDADGNMFFQTGNGGNDTSYNAQGFPSAGDYGDTVLKIAPDSSTSPSNQNINGWGLKVVDYFTPYNAATISQQDWDIGSGAPILLPNGELVTGGKNDEVYVLNPNNMGHYNSTYDNIIQELPVNTIGAYELTPAYFNGSVYIAGTLNGDNTNSYYDHLKQFTVGSNGLLSTSPVSQSPETLGYAGGSPAVSANGSSNGVIWVIDTGIGTSGTSYLRAYNPSNLSNEIFDIALPQHAKPWATPTVANGWVYVPENGGLAGFSLNQTTTAPPAPTGLTAGPGNDLVSLSWNASVGANTYNLYRSTASGQETLVHSGIGGTSYTDTGLTNGTTYYYKVTAVNSAGESGKSNEASATPSASANLVQDPSFANQTSTGGGPLIAPWVGEGPATIGADLGSGYTGAGDTDTKCGYIYSGGTNAFSDIAQTVAVTPNTNYSLSAWIQNGNTSGFTEGVLAVESIAPGSTGPTVLNQVAIPAATPNYTLFSLTFNSGSNSSLKVFAGYVPGAGSSWMHLDDVSLSASSVQAPPAPTGLSATAGNAQVSLSWNAVSGAASYNLYRATSSGQETLVHSGISGTSYTDTGLTNGTTYYYEVTAVNSGGESTKSSQVSAMPTGTTAGNLVQDPSFENQSNTNAAPLVAPWFVQNPSGEDVGVEVGSTAHTGSKEAYWYQPGTGTGFTDVYQTVNVTPNINYTLTGWFDNNDTSTFTGGEFGARTTGGSLIQETAIPQIGPGNSSASYQQLTVTFNSGSNSQLVVFGGYTPQQYSWLHMDDVSLTANTTQAPAAPTGLAASAGNAQVSLSWNASTGATSYNLYRSTNSGQETLVHSGIGGTSYTDTGLTNNTTYYYQVTAVNSAGESAKSSQVSAIPQGTTSGGVFIDSGGGAAGNFVADTDVSGGGTYSFTNAVNTTGVNNPAPQAVWQSDRWGNSTYAVPNLTPGGSYQVRFDFDEDAVTGPGQREFNVTINGTQILTNFDIYAAAGGQFIGITRSFNATADSSGTITIQFTTVVRNAMVSGIEITPVASSGTFIDSGGGAAGSFVADTDVSGGTTNTISGTVNTSGVSNPAPQAVWQSYRYGNFTYTVPNLQAGAAYQVRLDFADDAVSGPGQRVFNVSINGTQVLTNFDIYATAGGNDIGIAETFNATASSSGAITIQFTTVIKNSRVNGIEITPASTAPSNLVQDPSFENQSSTNASPLVSPWVVANPSGEDVGVEVGGTAHTGAKEAYWYQPGTGTGFTDVYQTVNVTPNINYTLTGWFDNNDTSTFTGGEFGARTTGGSLIQETAIPQIGPGNSSASYQQLTVTFNSGSNSQLVVFGGYTPQQYSWLHMDDVSLIANAEMLAGSPVANSNAPTLSPQQLNRVVGEAIQEWAAIGLNPAQVSALEHVQFVIAPMPAGVLGQTLGNTITIDATADGYGWSLGAGQPAPNKVDLLTVVAHELGHELGLGDVDPKAHPGDLMDATLPVGVRRLPSAYDISLLGGLSNADAGGYLVEQLNHRHG